MREEARRTRWLWTLPVENGYAASMLEVAERWSLADVLTVADRLEVRRREAAR